MESRQKTLVGVLASFDSREKNEHLRQALVDMCELNVGRLSKFHFLFTGGTFDRVVLGTDPELSIAPLPAEVRNCLIENSTRLPGRREGGVTILANFLVKQQCSILWPFLDPNEPHGLNAENLALLRLCDVKQAKRLRNSGSLLSWFEFEADRDANRNPQRIPLTLTLTDRSIRADTNKDHQNLEYSELRLPEPRESGRPFGEQTIALIAHDEKKPTMRDSCEQYRDELDGFERILATASTGQQVRDDTGLRITSFESGPDGGDIQIATEILAGGCDAVVFFLDPLRPHPHTDDIRVVLGACMIENNVRIVTNEFEARDWMDAVVRPGTVLRPEN